MVELTAAANCQELAGPIRQAGVHSVGALRSSVLQHQAEADPVAGAVPLARGWKLIATIGNRVRYLDPGRGSPLISPLHTLVHAT